MIRWHPRGSAPVASGVAAAATGCVPQYESLDDPQRERYLELVHTFANRLNWEAAHLFTLTDEMIGTIAGNVALMTLGLGAGAFRGGGTVVVHPSIIALTGPRPGPSRYTVVDGPRPVLGHTSATGPVFLAWDVVREHTRHPERGHNVVLHEFAHRLDALDGLFDGTPPLPGHRRERWISRCQREFDMLRTGGGSDLLDAYAATNPAEFFAVTTEAFFTRPVALRSDRPDLYAVVADYYQQDPASRCAR